MIRLQQEKLERCELVPEEIVKKLKAIHDKNYAKTF